MSQSDAEKLTTLRVIRDQLTNEQGIALLDEVIAALETGVGRQHTQQIFDSSVQLAVSGDIFGAVTINNSNTEQLAEILSRYLLPKIEYDHWRSQQNQWLGYCFRHMAESRAHLGQILNVAEAGIHLIERAEVWQQLDSWLEAWKSERRSMVVLGEEGDGKTWSVAAWIQNNMERNSRFPAVVFLSSAKTEANVVSNLLGNAISQRFSQISQIQGKYIAEQWVRNANSELPLAVLVLDGINERYLAEWWRDILTELQASPWINAIATIVTCRNEYWQRYFSSLRFLDVTTYKLSTYNDQELTAALAAHKLKPADIPPELLTLAQKPRYFDLFIRYREKITESGDPTVARLMYEDWRDRLERKSSINLDDMRFQNLLRELAGRYLAQQPVRDRDLADLLPFSNLEIIEELRTGGVLRERRGKYEVQEKHLVPAFGLLLVDQVEDAIQTGRNINETIAEWLEPHPEMDIKARICEAAVVHALQNNVLPSFAKTALLYAWMTSQNIGLNGLLSN